jgi:hypothetical protein
MLFIAPPGHHVLTCVNKTCDLQQILHVHMRCASKSELLRQRYATKSTISTCDVRQNLNVLDSDMQQKAEVGVSDKAGTEQLKEGTLPREYSV